MEHETSQDATQTALAVLKGANSEQVVTARKPEREPKRTEGMKRDAGRPICHTAWVERV